MVIGYINYLVTIFIVTGYMILHFDYRFYKKEKMSKEKKVAKFLGKCNVVLGITIFLANWVYHTWFR